MPRTVTRKKTVTKPSPRRRMLLQPAESEAPTLSPTVVTTEARIPSKGVFWRRPAVLGQVALLLAMLGVASYYYYQYRQTPEVAQRREIESLIKSVGKIVELPDNEMPTLATVTNKSKLDNQPFFQRTENGDKILIYRSVSRAFLYRPSVKKLIDITSINIETDKTAETIPANTATVPAPVTPPVAEQTTSDQTVAPSATDTAQAPAVAGASVEEPLQASEDILAKPVQVLLYNGSATVGITNTVETELKEKFPTVNILGKEKASKNSYQGYNIVDLTGDNEAAATTLANYLGGDVISLPAEENVGTDEADILIIVGNP